MLEALFYFLTYAAFLHCGVFGGEVVAYLYGLAMEGFGGLFPVFAYGGQAQSVSRLPFQQFYNVEW